VKAYVQHESKTGNRLATLDLPNLAAFLEHDRVQVREDLRAMFKKMLKKTCYVSFEDECADCGGTLDRSHCSNHECENGFPPKADLGRLMKDRPARSKESATSYIALLKQMWRAEIAGAEAAYCLKDL